MHDILNVTKGHHRLRGCSRKSVVMSTQPAISAGVVVSPQPTSQTPSIAPEVVSDPPVTGFRGDGGGTVLVNQVKETYERDAPMSLGDTDVLRLVLAKLTALESQNRVLHSEMAILRQQARDPELASVVTATGGGKGSIGPHQDMDCDESPVQKEGGQVKRLKGADGGARPRIAPPSTVLKAGGNVRRWLDEWANYFGATGISSGKTRLALGKLDHPLWGEVGRRFGVSLPDDADSVPWQDFVKVVGSVVRPTGSDFTIEAEQERLYIMYKGSMAENVKLFMGRFMELDQQRDRPMPIDNLLRLLIKKLPKNLAATIKFVRSDGTQWEHAAELLAAVLEEAVRQDTILESQRANGASEKPQEKQQQGGNKWSKHQGGTKRKGPWHNNQQHGHNQGKENFGKGQQGTDNGNGNGKGNGNGNSKPWQKNGGGKWKDRMQWHGTKGGK